MARRWNILGGDGAHEITNENETAERLQKLNLEKHEVVSWLVHEVNRNPFSIHVPTTGCSYHQSDCGQYHNARAGLIRDRML